jgi:hypothetical protein
LRRCEQATSAHHCSYCSGVGAAFADKHFEARDGVFHGQGGEAVVYEVVPTTVVGFGKGRVQLDPLAL